MLQIAERTSFTACLSIPTLDEKAWRATEPHTPSPRARLEAVAELNRAGIPTGVLIAPLMPGINDAPEQIERAARARATRRARRASAVIALHLRGEVREVFMDWLATQRPDLVPRYERALRARRLRARRGTQAARATGAPARGGPRRLPRATAATDPARRLEPTSPTPTAGQPAALF